MIHGHMTYDVSVSSYDEGSFKEKRNYMRMHILRYAHTSTESNRIKFDKILKLYQILTIFVIRFI